MGVQPVGLAHCLWVGMGGQSLVWVLRLLLLPYSSYPSASYWLTDYMISSDLQAAYAAHQEAGEVDGAPPAAAGPPELTPEVKQQIADEVRNQLALENQEAALNAHQQDVDPGSSGIDRMLSDAAKGKQHVFVVGSALDVVDASQTECALSDGDVLALQTAPPADAKAADLVVLSSKGGQECQKQAVVSVAFETCRRCRTTCGRPSTKDFRSCRPSRARADCPRCRPPQRRQRPPCMPPMRLRPIRTPPRRFSSETQQGDQVETEVSKDAGVPMSAAPQSASHGGSAAAAPATVELGQTPSQVQAAMGAPARVANLGPKVVYYYNGMKVTFNNGKVSDVQ